MAGLSLSARDNTTLLLSAQNNPLELPLTSSEDPKTLVDVTGLVQNNPNYLKKIKSERRMFKPRTFFTLEQQANKMKDPSQVPVDKLAMLMRPVCEACPFDQKKDKLTPKRSGMQVSFVCPRCSKPVSPFIKAQIGEQEFCVERVDLLHP